VAERLLARVTADESLHYAFYRDIVAAALDLAPSAVVRAMRRQVLAFAMAGFGPPGLRERATRSACAGLYDLDIHQEQVLCPLLLDHWRLPELRGLDVTAARARDEVLGFLDSLRDGRGSAEEQRVPLRASGACRR
jgi:acyl-[acyl-carrier protein] desaturase